MGRAYLLGGFFQCAKGDMVKGYPGKYTTYNKFLLKAVANEEISKARRLVHLSDQILEIQDLYAEQHKSSEQVQKAQVDLVIGMDNPHPVKICMAVPMTSKGTMMTEVTDSPFWSNLFDSFMKSIDWRSNRYIFKFYLGFDKAGTTIYLLPFVCWLYEMPWRSISFRSSDTMKLCTYASICRLVSQSSIGYFPPMTP